MIDRFQKLFKGLTRAYGSWKVIDLKKGQAKTIKEDVDRQKYQEHIDGTIGLGIIPIDENSKCHFGAIDIDDHKGKINSKIDHKALAIKVGTLGLPLAICRSKSGGAHCFHFAKDPITAEEMKSKLHKWAQALNFKNVEIFPKQGVLPDGQIGNWINLPYFGKDRYGYDKEGKALDLEDFIKYAESIRDTEYKPSFVLGDSLPEAPPCLDFLFGSGGPEGSRNDALFNFGVYFKRAFPDTWEDELYKINYSSIDPPVSRRELGVLVRSLNKTDYLYKCKQDPLKSVCNSAVCKKREFGINVEEPEVHVEAMIGSLTKINADPPKWILEVSGEDIILDTADLFSYRKTRFKCAEKVNAFIPKFTQEAWDVLLAEKFESLEIVEAPEEISEWGQVVETLEEFVHFASEDREMLLTSSASFKGKDEQWYVGFQFKNFEQLLKNKRVPLIKRGDMYVILKKKNFTTKTVRVNDLFVRCWVCPIEAPITREELNEIII